MSRYSRHISLKEVGEQGQQKISNASVLVIGAGGLGCPILQYITAAGVGTIGIVDFDTVELSNLQRQILFGKSSLGQNKAIAAKEVLLNLNDCITINTYPIALNINNAKELFENYDIIVDGTDNFASRYLINDTAILTNKPVVFGAIHKFEGQVAVFNYKGSASYRCLFPNPPEENSIKNCSEVGVLGVLPGLIGCMQANEVLKIILEFDDIIANKLYCYNALTTKIQLLKIKKSEEQIERVLKNKIPMEQYSKETCSIGIPIGEALEYKNSVFIDVREVDERPKIEVLKHLKIPLSSFEDQIKTIDISKTIILFCKSGLRSKKALKILENNNIKNSYRISDDLETIIAYLKNNKMSDKKKIKNVFKEGAISSDFIAKSITNHQVKTTIGAHNIFLGQVRADEIDGKTVTAIEYTAHQEMANIKFAEMREATFQKFDLTCMHIYHSIGTVKSGEICLFVFVSSKSRKVVFEALEYLVERIKAESPIFGKEIFEDDSHQWKVNS